MSLNLEKHTYPRKISVSQTLPIVSCIVTRNYDYDFSALSLCFSLCQGTRWLEKISFWFRLEIKNHIIIILFVCVHGVLRIRRVPVLVTRREILNRDRCCGALQLPVLERRPTREHTRRGSLAGIIEILYYRDERR